MDFNQTRDSMLGTELQSALEQFSKTMRETIDKGVQIMGESMKKELEKQNQNQTAPPEAKTQEPPKTTTL